MARMALTSDRLREDDSDALWLLQAFRGQAHVHAFEPNAAKAAELQLAATTRTFTRAYAANLTVHAVGVGALVGSSPLSMCGASNTWRLHTPKSLRCPLGSIVDVTTIDAFASYLGVAPLYVKVDVEGAELDVLRGMKGLLKSQSIELASFEYAVGWHRLFQERHPLNTTEALAARNFSLGYFQEQMSSFGYNTYLISAGTPTSGVVLVPVYDDFWHPDLEICFNRYRFYKSFGQWCWNDLLVVRRNSRCVNHVLFNNVLPKTVEGRGRNYSPIFSECDCL